MAQSYFLLLVTLACIYGILAGGSVGSTSTQVPTNSKSSGDIPVNTGGLTVEEIRTRILKSGYPENEQRKYLALFHDNSATVVDNDGTTRTTSTSPGTATASKASAVDTTVDVTAPTTSTTPGNPTTSETPAVIEDTTVSSSVTTEGANSTGISLSHSNNLRLPALFVIPFIVYQTV